MNDHRSVRSLFALWSAALLLLACCGIALPADRPAPAASKYSYTLELDEKSLPKGVKARREVTGETSRYFLKNESDVPLVIDERFQDSKRVGGTKLVSGKVYGYFPSGVPMEGKTHLKGWQAPFGDIEETLLTLPKEPAGVAKGREPSAPDEVPPPEAVVIRVTYDDESYEIKATVHYRLNKSRNRK